MSDDKLALQEFIRKFLLEVFGLSRLIKIERYSPECITFRYEWKHPEEPYTVFKLTVRNDGTVYVNLEPLITNPIRKTIIASYTFSRLFISAITKEYPNLQYKVSLNSEFNKYYLTVTLDQQVRMGDFLNDAMTLIRQMLAETERKIIEDVLSEPSVIDAKMLSDKL